MNPFKKFRRQPRRTNSIQLENRLTPVLSEGGVRLSEERRRRRDMTDGLVGPEHADSFPPQSAGTDLVGRTDSNDKAGTDPSMHSQVPINVPRQDEPDDLQGPRKRRTFLSNTFKPEDDQLTTDSGKPIAKKHKFTVMGQLKATIFNSWINVLLVAAPVGSKYFNRFSRSCTDS